MMAQNMDVVKRMIDSGVRPVRPNHVFLMLDEIQVETKLPSGIIVPVSTVKDEPMRTATVISAGSKVTTVKRMDRVMIGKFIGLEIPHEDSSTCKMVLVSEDQIDAMIE